MLPVICDMGDNNSLLVGLLTGAVPIEISVKHTPKAKCTIIIWSRIWLLGIYPKDSRMSYSRDTYLFIFIAVLFTMARKCKQPRCLSTNNGWNCDRFEQEDDIWILWKFR